MKKQFRVTRDVTIEECPWLDREFLNDEVVFEYTDYTYGCISPDGIACCLEAGKEPFFELPADALEIIK